MPKFSKTKYGKDTVQTTNMQHNVLHDSENCSWYENPLALKGRAGSSPVPGTKKALPFSAGFFCWGQGWW
jgi:hypothetical protein